MNKDMHQIYESYKTTAANHEIINEGLMSRIGSRVAGVGSALTGGGYQAGKINAYKAAANKKINALTRELATDLQKLGINVDVAKLSNQMASQINGQMDGMVNSILTGSTQSSTTASQATPAAQSSTTASQATPAAQSSTTPNAAPVTATTATPASQQQGSAAGSWLRRAGQAAGDTIGNFVGGGVGGVQAGYQQAVNRNSNRTPAPVETTSTPTKPKGKPKQQSNEEEDCETYVDGVKTRTGLQPQVKPKKFFP